MIDDVRARRRRRGRRRHRARHGRRGGRGRGQRARRRHRPLPGPGRAGPRRGRAPRRRRSRTRRPTAVGPILRSPRPMTQRAIERRRSAAAASPPEQPAHPFRTISRVPLEVVPVAYGAPAHDELARRVAAAKAGDPLRPVTVVVPSNYVGVAARRRLAAERRPHRRHVPHRLPPGRAARRSRRWPPRAAARCPTRCCWSPCRRSCSATPGVFAAVRDHPATEEALVAAHKQLADLSPAALAALAAASRQAHDVVGLHRRVKAPPRRVVRRSRPRGGRHRRAGPPAIPWPPGSATSSCSCRRSSAGARPRLARRGGRAVAGHRAGRPHRRAEADAGVAAVARLARLVGGDRPRAARPLAADRTAEPAGDHRLRHRRGGARRRRRPSSGAARAGTPLERIAVVHPGGAH